MTSPTPGESFLTAVAAGSLAAAMTSFLTYPLDFIKTGAQLSNRAALKRYNITQSLTSISHVMTGSLALVAGSVTKNFARFASYNWASNFMAIDTHRDKKKTSPPRVVIAGAITGFVESLCIIPFERIKTTMIQNRLLSAEIAGNPNADMDITGSKWDKGHKGGFAKLYVSPHAYLTSEAVYHLRSGKNSSRFSHHVHHRDPLDALRVEFNKNPALTFINTVKQMYALEGIYAFTAGSFITITRQVGTSAAWFSTYSATRQLIDPHGKSQEPSWFTLNMGTMQQAGLYFVSAGAAVGLTQPLDVIKSHIQLKNGRWIYRDALSTAYRIVARKGFWLLYAGAVPRGFKIAAHGSLTAFLYAIFDKGINNLAEKSVFTD